jgi:hypothetical protein
MVTVDKALRRGQFIVNVPVFLIMFSVSGLCIVLPANKLAPGYLILLGIALGPLAGWIYWSFAITRWRIWAFTNVDDINELKSRAISSKLIWPDGHIFEKTEIRTKKEKEIIKKFEDRFINEPQKRKIINDDLTVPTTTQVFYSKKKILVETVLCAALLSFGIYLLTTPNRWILGLFFSLIGGYVVIKDFFKLINDRPQLILNEIGIKIKNKDYSWTEVSSVNITTSNNKWLTLETIGGTVNETIDDYDISIADLEHRINVYLLRSEQATTANRVARPTSRR